mmetsp:Transcript_16009/g.15414  ORF Transcript_16009/g.15414 Transcript_16009/m.15414 type:complete len:190 (-) Transcript_16009:9-578(-)
MGLYIFYALQPNTNLDADNIIGNIAGIDVRQRHCLLWFSFLTGTHYNVTNFLYGFLGATDKVKAFKCLIPIIQVYLLIYLITYSQFFDEAVSLFLAGIGLYLTYVAGFLNMASTADIPFPYHYADPYIFLVILYLDSNKILPRETLLILYAIQFTIILIKYLYFMYRMVKQLTEFLKIYFLRVKPYKTK